MYSCRRLPLQQRHSGTAHVADASHRHAKQGDPQQNCPGNGGVHQKITLSIEGALSGHSYCPDACHGSQANLHAELLGAPAKDHNPKQSHWGAHCEH